MTVITIGVVVAVLSFKKSEIHNTYTNADIISVITREKPVFLDGTNPVIEVNSNKQLEDGWHVITIKSIHEDTMSVPIFVVMTRSDNPASKFNMILGPDTHFTEAEMLQYNLPDSVIRELL